MELAEIIDLAVVKIAELSFDGSHIPKLDAYVKPTNHLQACPICGRNLEKGERVIKEIVGATRNGFLKYSYSHLDCHLAVVLHTALQF